MKRLLILSLASAVGLLTQSADAKVPGGPWRWLSLGWGDGYHAPPCPDRNPWTYHPHHHRHHAGMPAGHFAPGYPLVPAPYPPAAFVPEPFPHSVPTAPSAETDRLPPPPETPWPDASARLPR